MTKIYDHIVIGGGISGLSRAYKLTKEGKQVLLLEKSSEIGGVIRSKIVNGKCYEEGPNSFALTPEIKKIITELNLDDKVIRANEAAKKRYVFLNGKPRLINPKTLFFSNKIIGFKSKLSLITERFKKSEVVDNETLTEVIQRRFNNEILEKLFNPVVSGIYAGNTDLLSYKYSFPKLYDYEQQEGSFTKGFLQSKKNGVRREILSFIGGISTLTKALATHLNIKYNCEVEDIKYQDEKIDIITSDESFFAKEITICTPAYVTAKYLTDVNANLAEKLKNIEYPSLLSWQVAFNKTQVENRLESFGVLVPTIEHKNMKGVINYSEIFSNDDAELQFTVFASANKDNLEMVKTKIEEELRTLYQISGPAVYSNYTFYKKSIPQFYKNYGDILEEIDKLKKSHPNINLLGNWITGVAIGNCININ